MAHDVFTSDSIQDKVAADPVCAALEVGRIPALLARVDLQVCRLGGPE